MTELTLVTECRGPLAAERDIKMDARINRVSMQGPGNCWDEGLKIAIHSLPTPL